MPEEFVSDVSQLELGPTEAVDWSTYEEAATRRMTPPGGTTYSLRIPEQIGYRRGNDGQLVVQLDPLVIVGGEHDGFQIRFTTVSTKRFPNSNACTAGDVIQNAKKVGLLAADVQPVTKEQWAEAFNQLKGMVLNDVYCDWEARDKENRDSNGFSKTIARSMKQFPTREDGTHQDYIEIPSTTGGEARRVWGNLRVTARGFSPKKDQ